jgi:hypothetical protein
VFKGFAAGWRMVDSIIEMVGPKDSFVIIIIPRRELLIVLCGLARGVSSS